MKTKPVVNNFHMKILRGLKVLAMVIFLLTEILILAFIALDLGNIDAGYLSSLRGPAYFIFLSFLVIGLAVIAYRQGNFFCEETRGN